MVNVKDISYVFMRILSQKSFALDQSTMSYYLGNTYCPDPQCLLLSVWLLTVGYFFINFLPAQI